MLQPIKIKNYLAHMAQRCIGAEAVLANTGLHPQALDAPGCRIDLAQSQVLIHNMLNLSGDEALGFELGSAVTVSEMGVVGRGMIASPRFRDTINLWAAYAPTLYGTMIQLSLEEEPNVWHMLLKEELPPGLCYQFCLEEYLALVMNMGGQMFGKPITYRSLDISYSAPRHAALYEQLFDCPVNFDMGFNRISVLSPGLDDFIETRDEYLYGIYQRYCERQSKQQAHRGAYAYKVHNYLLKNLGNPPSLEALARQLDCSTATLRRRLNSEDLNFRDLVNSFRRDFAEEHFKSTNLSAKEVAYLLGYTDTKPFLRAFKLWTGMTVGDYRRTHSVASNA